MNGTRRRWLQALALAGAPTAWTHMARALAAGDLPPGLHRLEGSAAINGAAAKAGSAVKLGDRIATGAASQAIVVLQRDAFLLRANTTIEVKGREGVLSDLLVAGGKVLSVFSKKPVAITARAASIGIRGTGAYLEVEGDEVYFCLCYGEAQVEGGGLEPRVVKTTHHEQPLLLRAAGGKLGAEPGPFRNHSDAELVMLEALVGREPPFMKGGQYPAKQY